MTQSNPKIEVKELTILFGATPALNGVSFDVRHQEILAVIGPANSGKSSLLLALNRMLSRIHEASVTGSILLDGRDIGNIEDVEDLRRRVGMVYAMPIALPMTIRENVLFGIRLKRTIRKNEGDTIVESTLRSSFLWDEVKDRLDTSALNLSGGQQQRLCLARTLAVGPEVILYDEPCSGLDPISTAKVEEAMKELKTAHTQILVTNNTKQAARVGDRTAFLLMGELVEIDDTDKIFTFPSDPRTEQYVTGKFG
ncbi:MAG: phosphate ABC transporter ATP-binding protein [Deltaproteobacteria bacterium RIFOXYA12_FULL_58_15]|nr:MAG: phosphate ABC transporter ATP-binding protein [Deltaproteobacteria bacterium RIFOXYA12_FULL_58_15]OGR09026.1 MAG: phosphate ABC transporter ATP-binding protein [Deltaproteobacteria bacterium RIFOXYB12_FULL_58_9]